MRWEKGRVSAAVGASSSKAVLLCKLWHWASLAGVHRVAFGCVLLHVVGVGFADWIIGSIVVGCIVDGNIVIVLVSMLGSIQLSARSWQIACWRASRLAIWGSRCDAGCVGVELVLLVAGEPMVVVIMVAVVIAVAE